MSGVIIGNGAIIASIATVGCNISLYTSAVCNPALVVKKRFDDKLISLLEELKWWDKPIE